MPKFDNVSCSQCGQSFGPGDSGFSDCEEHSPLGVAALQTHRGDWILADRETGIAWAGVYETRRAALATVPLGPAKTRAIYLPMRDGGQPLSEATVRASLAA